MDRTARRIPSTAVGIVAHQTRLDQAKHLFDLVGADVMMIDDDTLRLGCAANHTRTWAALLTDHADNADWLIVLEDDAVPCDDFRHQLASALAVAPAPYVSLYLGRGFPRHWQTRYQETIDAAGPNTCWATTSGYMLHAVGIAARIDMVPGMLKHLEQTIGVPVDQAIGQHARNTQQPVAYTLPSLVDHADGPTIHIHQDGQDRPPGRTAWTTGTRHTWTNQAIRMG